MPKVGTKITRVLVVDDAQESRDALRRALSFDGRIEVVGEAASGVEALTRAEELQPDVVLMDVNMPGGDGVTATRELAKRLPSARVVALTMHDDAETVRAMLEAGAAAYVVKGTTIDKLVDAVTAAARGEGPVDERVLPHALAELRRLLREERDRREELERVSQMREEFVHVLAHELRSPLTVMSGVLQLLRPQVTGREAELLQSALRRAGDLQHLIEGLELMGEGKPEGAAANPSVALAGARARVPSAPAEVQVSDEVWPGIPERHLERIAFELLDNGLRHGSPPVRVSARREGRVGVLRVEDAGDFRPSPSLFRPFTQRDMSTTREHGGLGMGLFVAFRLCETLGGTLDVRREGDRTVAEARLPLA